MYFSLCSYTTPFVFERQKILQILCQHKIGMYIHIVGDLRKHKVCCRNNFPMLEKPQILVDLVGLILIPAKVHAETGLRTKLLT